MMRLEDDRVIARSAAERRWMARAVLEVGKSFSLISFRGADCHLHGALPGERPRAVEFARRCRIRLKQGLRLDVDFAPTRYKDIQSQSHLTHALHYQFDQEKHHGTACDPAFDASNVPDLLGMRLTGSYTRQNVQTYLPRITRDDIIRHLDVVPEQGPLLLETLADAAAAALALPDLQGRSRLVVEARRAAVQVGREGFGGPRLAQALSLTKQGIYTLVRHEPADPALRTAVELQWRFRSGLLVLERQRGLDAGALRCG